jgi:proteasome accessory factor A
VTAYGHLGSYINWNFDDEHPGADARDARRFASVAPIIETNVANTVLTNGARFYVDHAHPEYSGPEVRRARDAVLYDLAGDEVLRRAVASVSSAFPEQPRLVVHKNNSDGKGNSYGSHENYLVSREIEFDALVAAMVPHFVTRSIYVGTGKLGSETPAGQRHSEWFHVSQRAEFFEEVVGLETTLKRPIINTRDEPHSDLERYRRFHVITGDAQQSHIGIFLKVGTTALLLGALEEFGSGVFPAVPDNPVTAFREIGRDSNLRATIRLADGRLATAIDVQRELLAVAERFVMLCGGELVGGDDEASAILEHWSRVLDDLAAGDFKAADRVEWMAKLRIVSAFRDRYGCAANDPRLAAVALQWHDLRPERNLFAKASMVELWSSRDIDEAVAQPPRDTRAYFRGRCIEKFGDAIAAANWDSVLFDLQDESVHRVPMMEPLRGTADLTATLIDSCGTAEELIRALGA